MFRLKHNQNPYFTHQPILYEILNKINKPILELGCGEGSTELIHILGEKYNNKIISVESDKKWFFQYQSKYENKNHKFLLIDHSLESWNKIIDNFLNTKNEWGLIFIDQGFWEARSYAFKKLKNLAQYLILHDCDYFPEHNLLGISIEKYIDKNNRGKRDYNNEIKYSKEFFPKIFVGHTGPPTLLASEFNNCDLDINFDIYDVII